MHRVRAIQEPDFESVFSLALEAHLGFTNLPKNPKKMRDIFENALASFQDRSEAPFYFFVLENIETNEILGTAGIYAKKENLHYYKLEKEPLAQSFQEVPSHISLLKRIHYRDGPSELCSLFLKAKTRKEGLGKLLSFSRFLFIANQPSRFTKEIFADLSGIIDDNGFCPFWEGIGRHFFPVNFQKLMMYRDMNKSATLDLMPKHPIYLDLIPSSAREAVGQPHHHGRPALKLLLDQGFKITDECDLYDAGPRLIADITAIPLVHKSCVFTLKSIESTLESPFTLISNHKSQFRACFGKLNQANCSTDRETARMLDVDIGELIRYVP